MHAAFAIYSFSYVKSLQIVWIRFVFLLNHNYNQSCFDKNELIMKLIEVILK